MKVKTTILLLAAALSFPALADKAIHKSSAVYSPGCDEEALKSLAGDALINISKQQNWSNNSQGYILTMDLTKMDYSALISKMMKAKCFTKPKNP